MVEIPNVVGDSRDGAINALRNSGFQVNVEESYSSNTAAGYVISQDPSGGASIERGSTITITVSLGPEPQQEPSTPSSPDEEGNQPGGDVQPGGPGETPSPDNGSNSAPSESPFPIG